MALSKSESNNSQPASLPPALVGRTHSRAFRPSGVSSLPRQCRS